MTWGFAILTTTGALMLAVLSDRWRLRLLWPVALLCVSPFLVHWELQYGVLALGAFLMILAFAEVLGGRGSQGQVIAFSEKIVRIAHLSDLHYPSRSEEAATALRAALTKLRPDILVVTGDLQDHPWLDATAVRAWLEDTARGCGLTDSHGALLRDRVIVLAGNHDLFVFGLTGVHAITGPLFRRQHGIRRCEVQYVATARVAFFHLDLNPAAALFSAEGTVYVDRLDSLREAIATHPLKSEILSATRILLVHPHPLPVPYNGTDFLLATQGTHHLLRFMAEQRIHMVLHGHKHFATWSHLRVGGATDHAHFLEILGAGSAMKDGDIDSRGHNFNLITVSDAGVRRVRQYFKHPAASQFEEKPPSEPERETQALVTGKYSARYRIAEIICKAEVDGEGTAKNRYTLRGVDFRGASDAVIRLPKIRDEFGVTGRYQLASGYPAGWSLAAINPAHPVDYELRCPGAAGDAKNDTVTVINQGYGTFALDAKSALNIGLQRVEGAAAFEEQFNFTLRECVGRLRIEICFPETFAIEGAAVTVTENDHALRNEPMTKQAAACLKTIRSVLVLDLREPEPNLTYRIRWRIPFPALEEGQIGPEARRIVFERNLWSAMRQDKTQVERALAKFAEIILEELAVRLGTDDLPFDDFDLSLMVRDLERPKPGKGASKPVLYVAVSDRVAQDHFSPCVGQGNAGVAYLSGNPRFFDWDAPDIAAVYDGGHNGVRHRFLASYPLVELTCGLPLLVLNIGTASPASATIMRPLASRALVQSVLPRLHTAVLRPLLKLASLKEGVQNVNPN